mmetsp:Transcript_60279/g.165172  ORF Transcript_60279/g.165172 Transcript_60279/m.165172 type:complete len:203 (-) Transcript_60279:149-757(-)
MGSPCRCDRGAARCCWCSRCCASCCCGSSTRSGACSYCSTACGPSIHSRRATSLLLRPSSSSPSARIRSPSRRVARAQPLATRRPSCGARSSASSSHSRRSRSSEGAPVHGGGGGHDEASSIQRAACQRHRRRPARRSPPQRPTCGSHIWGTSWTDRTCLASRTALSRRARCTTHAGKPRGRFLTRSGRLTQVARSHLGEER